MDRLAAVALEDVFHLRGATHEFFFQGSEQPSFDNEMKGNGEVLLSAFWL
jgi:hypothetical protein